MNEVILLSTLGSKIKTLRREKCLTQNELAALCNFEKAGISRIESGQTNITLRTLLRISSVLEVSLADLFGDLKYRQE